MHDIVNIPSATFKMVNFMLREFYLNQKPSFEEKKKKKIQISWLCPWRFCFSISGAEPRVLNCERKPQQLLHLQHQLWMLLSELELKP